MRFWEIRSNKWDFKKKEVISEILRNQKLRNIVSKLKKNKKKKRKKEVRMEGRLGGQ